MKSFQHFWGPRLSMVDDRRRVVRSRGPEAGVGVLLLEMVICLAILAVLAAQATPNYMRVRQSQEAVIAKAKVLSMAQLQTALTICAQTQGCVPNAALQAQVPNIPPGTATSIQQGGYLFSYQNTGGGFWIYTAVAQGSIFSPIGMNYWTDTTAVVRCGIWPNGGPC